MCFAVCRATSIVGVVQRHTSDKTSLTLAIPDARKVSWCDLHCPQGAEALPVHFGLLPVCIAPAQLHASHPSRQVLTQPQSFACACSAHMLAASSPGQTCPEQAPEHPRPRRNGSWYPPLAPQVRGTQCGKQMSFSHVYTSTRLPPCRAGNISFSLSSSTRLDAAVWL